MARVTIEDCLKNVDSRFTLVHLAVRRVLQVRSGSPYTIETPRNKEVVLALREIAAGTVTVDNIRRLEEVKALPEAVAPEVEEATRRDVKEILDEATQYDASMEFEETEQLVEPGEPTE